MCVKSQTGLRWSNEQKWVHFEAGGLGSCSMYDPMQKPNNVHLSGRASLGLGEQRGADLRRVLQHPPRSGPTQLPGPASDSLLMAFLPVTGGDTPPSPTPSIPHEIIHPSIIHQSLSNLRIFSIMWLHRAHT